MPYTQENRIIAVETPLGEDVLLLHKLVSNEGISRLFQFDLDLLSVNESIGFDQIVGQRVSISFTQAGGEKRYVNGFVSRFSQGGADTRFAHYHAEVVPWLWFLTRTAACRIFQNMTVPDILAKMFTDFGFNDFKKSLQGSYEQWDYCVQYRETAFNFVSRLMEQEGIYYFFEHEKDKHTLVLADRPSAHKPCPGQPKARLDYTPGGYLKEDVIHDWHVEQELRTGKYSLKDYNFETPSTDLEVKEPSIVNVDGNSKYEIYDYPGEYVSKAEGETIAKTRMQEEESTHLLVTGSGNCRKFVAGFRFDLEGHARQDMNKPYVLTEVHHSASVGSNYDGESSTEGEQYSNHFSCIPLTVPFRPARHTPKPFVQGPQTAVVVGKSGEEIWTDKYGRVKVQFHWDREGKKDENSSCWVRVSQLWAGKNWGAMFIPRIGQEVIVDFLEGDPDQPIITGRVYNAEQIPHLALPDSQTLSGIITRSTKNGASSNFNAIAFDDNKGSEQLIIHAEKDKSEGVEYDSREWVGNNRHLLIETNQLEKVKGNRDEEVVGKHTEKIGGDNSLHVLGDSKEKIGGSMSINIGQSLDEKSGMKFAHEAGQEIHLKAGMNVVIEAGMELTIKASGGFINIGPAGVAISGTLVLINSGGAAGSGSGASPQNPSAPQKPDITEHPEAKSLHQ
jgi:type VI secretion system secreted protein VgrG